MLYLFCFSCSKSTPCAKRRSSRYCTPVLPSKTTQRKIRYCHASTAKQLGRKFSAGAPKGCSTFFASPAPNRLRARSAGVRDIAPPSCRARQHNERLDIVMRVPRSNSGANSPQEHRKVALPFLLLLLQIDFVREAQEFEILRPRLAEQDNTTKD